MQTLPPPIRNYLTQGKYTAVARNLTAKYGLRIDQAGVLEREIMLLLMGIETPDEFAASLKSDARLTDDVVRTIMSDANQQIFVPLREEMMKAGVGTTPPAPPVRKPEIPSVKPEAGPGQPESHFHLQNKISAPSAPQNTPSRPPMVPPRPPAPSEPSARPGLRDALAAITGAPKEPENEKLLEDHEEPHIEFNKTPPAPPRPTQQPAPSLRTVPTPPNLPGTPGPLPVRPVSPSIVSGPVTPRVIPAGGRPELLAPKPGTPSVPPASPHIPPTPPNPAPPPPKAYTSDPYREPIEP